MKKLLRNKELGSLAHHCAWLGKAPRDGSRVPFVMSPAAVFRTQVRGLKARLRALGYPGVVLGLSGGLDSSLALLVAAAAFAELKLDRSRIYLYTLPGFGTSHRTRGNAGQLAAGLGMGLETIDIRRACRQHFRDIGHDGQTPDITFENAQARMRTLILMDKANMTGSIVLGTGDMSEIALGWSTYNGDHMSMFAVNNGIPKTVVQRVCGWWAKRHVSDLPEAAAALADIVATPVSPELLPGQVTEDTLGPYELHDFFLWNFIVNEMGSKDLLHSAVEYFGTKYPRSIIERTLKTFMRRFFTQAFKRNCQPDGIRVFPFELSLRDWWIPSDLGEVRL